MITVNALAPALPARTSIPAAQGDVRLPAAIGGGDTAAPAGGFARVLREAGTAERPSRGPRTEVSKRSSSAALPIDGHAEPGTAAPIRPAVSAAPGKQAPQQPLRAPAPKPATPIAVPDTAWAAPVDASRARVVATTGPIRASAPAPPSSQRRSLQLAPPATAGRGGPPARHEGHATAGALPARERLSRIRAEAADRTPAAEPAAASPRRSASIGTIGGHTGIDGNPQGHAHHIANSAVPLAAPPRAGLPAAPDPPHREAAPATMAGEVAAAAPTDPGDPAGDEVGRDGGIDPGATSSAPASDRATAAPQEQPARLPPPAPTLAPHMRADPLARSTPVPPGPAPAVMALTPKGRPLEPRSDGAPTVPTPSTSPTAPTLPTVSANGDEADPVEAPPAAALDAALPGSLADPTTLLAELQALQPRQTAIVQAAPMARRDVDRWHGGVRRPEPPAAAGATASSQRPAQDPVTVVMQAARAASTAGTPPTAPTAIPASEPATATLPVPTPPAATAPVAMLQPAPAAAPVTEARMTAPPGSAEFTSQLGSQLTTFVRDGVQHARLHLSPEEMGPVTVQIRIDGPTAQLHMAAENSLTRQALEQSMPLLASSLREAGLTLGGGGVFEQPRQSRDEAPPGAAAGQHPGPQREDDAMLRPGPAPARRRGVVDLVA